MASLTAEKVRGLRDKGRYGDGGGLYLYLAPGGTKSWVLRVREDGRRTDKGLGGYPAVSLTAARKAAEAYRVARPAAAADPSEGKAAPGRGPVPHRCRSRPPSARGEGPGRTAGQPQALA